MFNKKVETRHGVVSLDFKIGLKESIFVGLISGVITYTMYRASERKGFMEGYFLGSPDEKLVNEIIDRAAAGQNASDIVRDVY